MEQATVNRTMEFIEPERNPAVLIDQDQEQDVAQIKASAERFCHEFESHFLDTFTAKLGLPA